MSSPRVPQPVVVLISGRGSNMLSLIEDSRSKAPAYCITQVLSDRPQAPGLAAARELGVATLALTPPSGDRAAYDRSLAAAIDERAPALIVLAGFMRILSPAFVERYAGRILNIHPSLLPAYPGLHTHRRVLAARESAHGATVHFVTAELDGGPRIIQARIGVDPADDERTLTARVQSQEHRIYPIAVRWYCDGRLRCRDGHARLDGKVLEEPVQYVAEAFRES